MAPLGGPFLIGQATAGGDEGHLMIGIYQELVAVQREIYLTFADRIGSFAATGDWSELAVYLPMGIVFGAAHALTPGHSKAVLATYLLGSTASIPRGLVTSIALSFTHITISVLIVLLSLPLIRFGFGAEAGRAPMLELISRGFLGAVGVWMIALAVHPRPQHAGQAGPVFGMMAGLVPCPLTLFVMTFAVSRGVPQAGVAFAAVMMAGVALVLGIVALAAVFFRRQMVRLLLPRPRLVDAVMRTIQLMAGLILLVVALNMIVPV